MNAAKLKTGTSIDLDKHTAAELKELRKQLQVIGRTARSIERIDWAHSQMRRIALHLHGAQQQPISTGSWVPDGFREVLS